jgi:hypothetical protein
MAKATGDGYVPLDPSERHALTQEELVTGSFALSKLACIAMFDEMDQVLTEARAKLLAIRQRYTEMMSPGTKAHQHMVEALYRAGEQRREGHSGR